MWGPYPDRNSTVQTTYMAMSEANFWSCTRYKKKLFCIKQELLDYFIDHVNVVSEVYCAFRIFLLNLTKILGKLSDMI